MGAVTVVTTRVVVVPPIHHGWGGRDRGRGGVGFRHGLGVGEGRGKVLGVGLQGSWGDGDAVPLLSVLGDRVLYIFGHRIIEKMFVWELCLQSLDVTSVAEQVIVQWIAAFVGFICQLNSAVLSTETEYFRTLLSLLVILECAKNSLIWYNSSKRTVQGTVTKRNMFLSIILTTGKRILIFCKITKIEEKK